MTKFGQGMINNPNTMQLNFPIASNTISCRAFSFLFRDIFIFFRVIYTIICLPIIIYEDPYEYLLDYVSIVLKVQQ